MSSNSVGVSSKKSKRINAFPLVGKQKQVNFDHQQMATFDERIKKAALAIELRAITRAGARGTPTKSPDAPTTMPPKIPSENIAIRPVEAKLDSSCSIFSRKQSTKGSAWDNAASIPNKRSHQKPKTKPENEIQHSFSEHQKWFGRRQ